MAFLSSENLLFLFVLLFFSKFDGYFKWWKFLTKKFILFIPFSDEDVGKIIRKQKLKENAKYKSNKSTHPEAAFTYLSTLIESNAEVVKQSPLQSNLSLFFLIVIYASLLFIKFWLTNKTKSILLPTSIIYIIIGSLLVSEASLHFRYSDFRLNHFNRAFPLALGAIVGVSIMLLQDDKLKRYSWFDFDINTELQGVDQALRQLLNPLHISHVWISTLFKLCYKICIISILTAFSLLVAPLIQSETQLISFQFKLSKLLGPLYPMAQHYEGSKWVSSMLHITPFICVLMWNPAASQLLPPYLKPHIEWLRFFVTLGVLCWKLQNTAKYFQYSTLYESKTLMEEAPSDVTTEAHVNAINHKLNNTWISAVDRLMEHALPYMVLLLLLLPVGLSILPSSPASPAVSTAVTSQPTMNFDISCSECIVSNQLGSRSSCLSPSYMQLMLCSLEATKLKRIEDAVKVATAQLSPLQFLVASMLPSKRNLIAVTHKPTSHGVSTLMQSAQTIWFDVQQLFPSSVLSTAVNAIFVGCLFIYCSLFVGLSCRHWLTGASRYESLWND